MMRGFQTREAEMNLDEMVGDLSPVEGPIHTKV
jgi:hypothetical protein